MAISTLDGAAAGTQQISPWFKVVTGAAVGGRPISMWGYAGIPGAGSYDTTLNGVTLSSSDSGSLMRGNPGAGNSYVHSMSGYATIPGVMLLVDRLWHNGGFTITSTSGQSITSPTWPSRCPTSATDATPTTTGHGVYLGVEVSATTGAGTPTLTVAYTNSTGTASRTGTNVLATVGTAPTGVIYPIGLQAGDVGVRSVQSLTLSASWTSGTINMVAYRILAVLTLSQYGLPYLDPLSGGLQRVYDSSCLSLIWIPATTTSSNIYGALIETQG